jgi:preprotein translocase subunit YajC
MKNNDKISILMTFSWFVVLFSFIVIIIQHKPKKQQKKELNNKFNISNNLTEEELEDLVKIIN